MDASTSDPTGVVFCNPFKWDILCSFLIKKVIVFVRATTANQISFHNHRNRKVIGGKHNVLVLYVDASAPNLSGAVLCNHFKWDILWFTSNQKLCFWFVPSSPVKWISFCNHKNRKVVGGKHNVLVHCMDFSAPNLSGVVLSNPLKWDILLLSSGQNVVAE